MKVYFVRHAQTKENEEIRLQGPLTGDFTREGKKQLKRLKRRLEKINFDIIFSSDLRRCMNTTKYLYKKEERKVKYLSLLREKNNGDFVGVKAKEIDWNSLPGTFETRKLPGGESLEDVRERVDKFLKLLGQQKGKNILVIGHGAFLKILLGKLLGFDLRRTIFGLHIDHCSTTTIEINKNSLEKILSINDTGHI
jgi:broad specificity phosphatase PhoE